MSYKRLIAILFIMCALLTACASPKETVPVDAQEDAPLTPPRLNEPDQRDKPPAPSETPFGEVSTDGYAVSRLTGLPIPVEAAMQRPIAVVVNNIYRALPQSGIAQADLIYEVLAEANITRLVAIFQAHDTPKLGPVRSARDYFVDFALDYDAIFVHHGGSPSGYTKLKNFKIDRLDGINLEGPYFWRDRTYPSWDTLHSGEQRPMEHSSYTNSEKIKAAIEAQGFRDTLYEDAPFGFTFNVAIPLQLPEGFIPATVVKIPFSNDYTRTFTYDAETMLYTAANKNGTHKDAETAEPLTVSNILIQFVSMRVIPGDEAGRREVQTLGEGTGYLATAGGYTPIKWEKDDHTTPTRWYNEDGTPLRLNTGKTWVCVFQDYGEPVFEV